MKLKTVFISLTLILSLMLPPLAWSDGTCPGINVSIQPRGYVQIPVSSTAVALTSVTGRMAVIIIEANAVRYLSNGIPTATVGMPLEALNSLVVCGAAMSTIRFIRQSADAVINVEYFSD